MAFQPTDPRQVRHAKDCGRDSSSSHAARTTKRLEHDVQFVAVDGEGVTREDGTHEYVLLSIGQDSLYHEDGSVLGWEEIFQFLWDHRRDGVMVGYFLGYDFTQTLRRLPEPVARSLFTKEGIAERKAARARQYSKAQKNRNPIPMPVVHGGWQFDILGMKRLKLKPARSKEPWVYVCDAGPFWQSSFLKAIDPGQWPEPICTPEEYEEVEIGKGHRDVAVLDETMIRYNLLENQIMERMAGELNHGFVSMGIRLKKDQWFGPGQAAQAWMNGLMIPGRVALSEVTPADVLQAAIFSYYGGWFELTAHGRIPGIVHEWDLNSAYPYAISKLPCLMHGRWTRQGSVPTPYVLVHADVTGSNKWIGAAPHRTPGRAIIRPQRTAGWYWESELRAGVRAGVIDDYVIDDCWNYEPCNCPPPFGAPMRSLYAERLRVGKNSPAGKACKNTYNSVYGKNAQSIGSPRFANPIYASMITSHCRSMILEAVAAAGPENVVMIATDGIYTTVDISDRLEVDPEKLGAWDHSVKTGMTLFMPGVYWNDESRERIAKGLDAKVKSRGVPAAAMAQVIGEADAAWDDWMTRGIDVDNWPAVEIPVPFVMVTPLQALRRGDWSLAGTVSRGTKKLTSDPSVKRCPGSAGIDDGIVRTYNWHQGPELESLGYDKQFGLEFQEQLENEMMLGVDGDAVQSVREMIM